MFIDNDAIQVDVAYIASRRQLARVSSVTANCESRFK